MRGCECVYVSISVHHVKVLFIGYEPRMLQTVVVKVFPLGWVGLGAGGLDCPQTLTLYFPCQRMMCQQLVLDPCRM